MSLEKARSPFDRLRKKFDDDETRCRQCGYVDVDGGWRVTAAGSSVQYQHVCPACDAVESKVVRLE